MNISAGLLMHSSDTPASVRKGFNGRSVISSAEASLAAQLID